MTVFARPQVAAVLAASLFALTACGAGARGQEASDTLRIAGPFEVHSLDPATDGEVFTRLQVTETLVTSDLEGTLAPALATEWSSSRNNTDWAFDLVEGATFHDGTPLTSDAVVNALTTAAAETASPLAGVPIDEIRAEESSVAFELAMPYPLLPAVLTHYSTAILAPASYAEGGHVDEVIGTGPYQVDRRRAARLDRDDALRRIGAAPPPRSRR